MYPMEGCGLSGYSDWTICQMKFPDAACVHPSMAAASADGHYEGGTGAPSVMKRQSSSGVQL